MSSRTRLHLRYDDFAANWFAPGGLVMPTESALKQMDRSRSGEKRSRCSGDPLENSETILL